MSCTFFRLSSIAKIRWQKQDIPKCHTLNIEIILFNTNEVQLVCEKSVKLAYLIKIT